MQIMHTVLHVDIPISATKFLISNVFCYGPYDFMKYLTHNLTPVNFDYLRMTLRMFCIDKIIITIEQNVI